MAGAIGGIVGGLVSNVVGGLAGNVLSSLMSSFGMNNVLGAFTNLINDSLGGALKGVINAAPLPNFLKDMANGVVDKVFAGNKQDTTPDCQCAVEDAYADAFNRAAETVVKEAADEAKGKKGANWLVALAGSLAGVQTKFLDAAMKNMETMEKNSEAATQDGADKNKSQRARDKFLMAQSEYQANMQMFNMMANMTATSLKSLGEGMTALARKQ